MKKILTALFVGLLLTGCQGELKYKGNYENLIVVSVKQIELPPTVKSEYKKEPICKYKVKNYDPVDGTYNMSWTFVDKIGKFAVGDTIKFVKK